MQPFLDQFLEAIIFESGLSEQTLSAYSADVASYLEYLHGIGVEHPKDSAREDLLDHLILLRKRPLSSRTVSRRVSAIRRFHRFLSEEGLADSDPTDGLEPPRLSRGLPHVLSRSEVEALRGHSRIEQIAVTEGPEIAWAYEQMLQHTEVGAQGMHEFMGHDRKAEPPQHDLQR